MTTSLENCETLTPGFDFTWETDVAVLREKLLAGGSAGLPAGVTISGVTLAPLPANIAQNESGGWYFEVEHSGTGIFDNLAPVIVDYVSRRIIYVDLDAPGSNDGTSWYDAYHEVQDALSDAAADPECVEIWVAEGSYFPDWEYVDPPGEWQRTGNRALSFGLVDGVRMYGGFEGYDSVMYPGGETQRDQRLPADHLTILSGDLDQDDETTGDDSENSFHVVTGSGTDATPILDGVFVGIRECQHPNSPILHFTRPHIIRL